MFNQFKKMFSKGFFPSRAEVERDYLNSSVSRFDLERRQREVDSGLFRRSAFDL